MNKIELKLKEKFGAVKNVDHDCFILTDGTVIETTEHEISCRAVNSTLAKFIGAGGCRVKLHGENIAIETGKPVNSIQAGKLAKCIRDNTIGYLVYYCHDEKRQLEIQDYYRIRAWQFQNGLKSTEKTVLMGDLR